MTFMETARRLAGQAGLLLGWRPDEFWRATPDELETALAALTAAMPAEAPPPTRAVIDRLKEMHPDG